MRTWRRVSRAVLVLMVGLSLLAQPARARTVVQCADGSPCPILTPRHAAADEPHDCCSVHPCHDDTRRPAPPSRRCVVKSTPPPEYVSARPAAAAVAGLEVHVLSPPAALVAVPAPARWTVVTPTAESPPWLEEVGRVHGPRAPPPSR